MNLQDKIICITGASSGIGEACAIHFARAGAKLVLGARRVNKLKQLEAELKSCGASDVLCLELDVRLQESVDNFHQVAIETFGAPDVLINNAGLVLGVDPISDGDINHWQTIFDTNVLGVLRICRAFINNMKEAKKGHIIFTGSISGHQVYEGGGPYCASKHGVKAICQTLKLELLGSKIRISSIDPGMVETEFSVVRLGSKEAADKVYEGLDALTANDIAECILFAASRPAHVNIDNMIVMPREQASVYKVHRE